MLISRCLLERNEILMFLKGVSVSILRSYVAVRADYLARASLRTQFHNDECSLYRRRELISGGGEGSEI